MLPTPSSKEACTCDFSTLPVTLTMLPMPFPKADSTLQNNMYLALLYPSFHPINWCLGLSKMISSNVHSRQPHKKVWTCKCLIGKHVVYHPSSHKAIGRWASDAFKIYVWKDPMLIQALLFGQTRHSQSTFLHILEGWTSSFSQQTLPIQYMWPYTYFL